MDNIDKEVEAGTKSWIPDMLSLLPEKPGTSTPEEYAQFFSSYTQEILMTEKVGGEIEDRPRRSLFDFIAKAINPPPSAFSFSKISNMPDLYNKGIIQWPGIPPMSIKKIASENIAPLLIIGMRQDDVYRYAEPSRTDEPWKPGWSLIPQVSHQRIDSGIRADIQEATEFLLNCNIEKNNYFERSALGLTSFRTFLGELTRDTLTYDGMAVWIDCDHGGRVKAFKALSAQNIRLCGRDGYLGKRDIFAVGMDEAGNVKEEFTRHDLIWHVRNPRPDPDIAGYGYPEIAQGVRLIQGFQNALDLNSSRFDRNSIPNGMFIFHGQGWVRAQLDRLARLFLNMKRGVTKSWTIPLIMAPKDAKVELLDFTNIKGNEVYYQDFMNMMIGAFCTIYRFPVNRIGYRTSGKGPDNEPPVKELGPIGEDNNDSGREPLLGHIEHIINIIIKTRWPHLKFVFHGKNPKEDAREYEARMHAMTVDERRTAVGLPPLSENESVKKLDSKSVELLRLMGSCPVDPGLAGVFQVLLSSSQGVDKGPEAKIQPKKDPAESLKHGHEAGVRRDSAEEKGKNP